MTTPDGTLPKADMGHRLGALRRELARLGLDGFIVPRADEHQGEYVPPSAERLAWITGFTGSAGIAVILRDAAAIFVDGRYTLQAQSQVDGAFYERLPSAEITPTDWIEKHLAAKQRLGYDPWLHTVDFIDKLKTSVARAGAELVPTDGNPLDRAWSDRPAPPKAKVEIQDLDLAGESAEAKRHRIGEDLKKAGCDAAILTLPDSIAWLLNIRGGDVPHTPFALSFAALHADGSVDWFVDSDKISDEVRRHLGNSVVLQPPREFLAALDRLGQAGAKVRLDAATAAGAIAVRLGAAGARILPGADPCQLPKACKNAVEIAGMRRSHRRDGAALTRFLAWLGAHALRDQVDELTAAAKLEAFRQATGELRDLSFDTIAGSGPNGAVVHYRATAETNRRLRAGELLLLDSGAQYRDGTTDVTRTIAIGSASAEQRDRFTRVLKGHIQLASLRFPEGTTGSQIDVLARHALWQAGLDYDHGTGHGVGSYLAVHEGPQRIHKVASTVALKPGMIVSNEPGYYKTGAFGIRIENLVLVTPPEIPAGGDRPMMSFETLTLAPIDRNLVEPSLLTAEERNWLNAYHARVSAELMPLLDSETAAWLEIATRPI